MTLHDNWRSILRNAWSIRFMALAGLFQFLGETVLPNYADYLPRNTFTLLSGLCLLLGSFSRLVLQKGT